MIKLGPLSIDTKKLSCSIDIAQKVFIMIGGTVGALWGLLQYYELRAEKRTKMTIEYSEKYNKDLRTEKDRVQKVWLNSRSEFRSALNSGEEAVVELILNEIESKGIESDLYRLLSFYSEVAICVRKNLCDKSLARDIFWAEIISFRNIHYPWIMRNREFYKNDKFAYELDFVFKARNE